MNIKLSSIHHSKRLLAVYLLLVPLVIFTLITGLSTSLSDIPSAFSQNEASDDYIGAETCGLCHRTEYAAWNQSYHNNAGLLNITDGAKYYWLSPEWLHDGATRIMDEAYFGNCASCHTTGYDSDTGTWPGSDSLDPEEAGAFLGVQCEVCHGPGGEHLDAPMDEKKDAIIIDYSYATCDTCHSQPTDLSMSGHNSSLQDAMSSSRASDSCLKCHSTQGYLGEAVTMTTAGLEPISCVACHSPHDATNEAQLREETPTDTCGTCHDYPPRHATEYTLYIEGPHEKAGLECTSCHGPGTAVVRGSVSEWFNHTLGVYNTYYPYNQIDPIVCGQCHDQSWATVQLSIIQETVEDVTSNVSKAIDDAEAAVETASQTSGIDQTKITQAEALVDSATNLQRLVNGDESGGFHNPEQSFGLLSEALGLAGEASRIANNAIQDTLSSQLSNVQTDLSSVQGTLSSTQTYMYVGAVGGIVGGIVLGLLVGRKWSS